MIDQVHKPVLQAPDTQMVNHMNNKRRLTHRSADFIRSLRPLAIVCILKRVCYRRHHIVEKILKYRNRFIRYSS